MKLTIILLFLVVFSVSAEGYGQGGGAISVRMENMSLKEIFQELKSHSDYTFVYNDESIAGIQVELLEVNDADFDQVMTECLKDTDLEYYLENDVVVIRKKIPVVELPVIKEAQQKKEIKGTVTDEKGTVLPGVSVVVKGTTIGTSTSMDGYYRLTIPSDAKTIVFSFIGMKPLEIEYTGQAIVDAQLETDSEQMEEIVVTGIFKKRQDSYAGSVTIVAEKELKMFGSRNVLTTLKNIDPSFNIMESNEFGSDPNRTPEISIRGNSSIPSVKDLENDTRANLNSPLIILDGFEITLQKMMDLNDDEVKSITLLKDASATAIYGSRGANGVVVITTKEPEQGKLKITIQSTANVEVADLRGYDLLNAQEKLDLEYKAGLYTDSNFLIKDQLLKQKYNENKKLVERGVDTDWISKPLRTGLGQRHNIRIEGGDSKMRYSASIDYNNIEGVMKGSDRTNVNGTVTLAYYHKNLVFRNQLNVGFNKSERSPYGSFGDYVRMNPYWSPYDEEGNMVKVFDRTPELWGHGGPYPGNPLYNASLNTVNSSEYTDIINNFSLEWSPTEDLTLRGKLGVSKQTNNSDNFKPASHTDFDTYSEEDIFRKGTYVYGTGKRLNYDMNVTLNYNKTIADLHQFYLGLDYNMAEKSNENFQFTAEGFANDNEAFMPLGLGYKKDGKPTGLETTSRRVGFTGNFNYIFDNRYFVDASYRIDGSSQFGSEKRFAPFWSTGIGWNIHKEDFLAESDVFNRLRLKGSYGTTGSQNFYAYQAVSTYGYQFGDRYLNWSGANLLGLGNKDLEWQTTKQYNIGLESQMFNTRVKFNADVYYKTTSNLLSQMDLPLSNGFSSYTENIGEVVNKGFEIMASAFIIRNTEKELIWSVTGRIAHNDSEITKLSDAIKKQNEELVNNESANPNRLIYEGDPLNAIYVVPSLGIDPSNGKELFLKKDGEVTYEWDASDRTFAGISEPKYRGNLSTMFRYKNFNMNVSFSYRWGGQFYNSTLISKVEDADLRYNVDRRVYEDRWIEPGDNALYKGLSNYNVTRASSRFVQDEMTLRCQNVNLSYDLKNAWLQNHLGLRSLRFTFNTENLFYLSSIKAERGIHYPFSRKFSMKVSARF